MFKEFTRILLLLLLFPNSSHLSAQTAHFAWVRGQVKDQGGKNLELVNISILGKPGGTTTDKNGQYEIRVPSDTTIILVFSYIGFERKEFHLKLSRNEVKILNVQLSESSETLPAITIQDELTRTTTLQRINPREVSAIPSVSGNIEALIRTLPGVGTTSELSSQYSVRGGNFDENLVYINDIEIYRPFLIRSGQQEGLSVLNSDLVSSILFSSGGFEAKYGDKMSSVLDIQYRNPTESAGSLSLGLLGGNLHVEGISRNRKFTHLSGIRYKTTRYILNALETKGNYRPSFIDFQTLLRYQLNPSTELSLFGNIADNRFEFVPQTRETSFGTISQVKRLTIYFDGREVDRYQSSLLAAKLTLTPQESLQLKFIASSYLSKERETFDIQGQYIIGEVDTGLGSSSFGETISTIGIGTFHDHARNYLNSHVLSAEHKGSYEHPGGFLNWGVKLQKEIILDHLKEWNLIDSAGFTLPRPPDDLTSLNPPVHPLLLDFYSLSDTSLTTSRIAGFLQNSWNNPLGNDNLIFIAGIRSSWWSYSRELLISPRISVAYQPEWSKDIIFRFSAGYYHQPAFYRELRDFNGKLVDTQKAQKSIHFVGGSDWNLSIWRRPFKLTSEIYYKYLDNLIPFEVDNVRIRYYATQRARGYAWGIDMKLNGEFVPGIESWASMSFMKTAEDIYGDYYWDYFDAQGNKIGSGTEPDPEAALNVKKEPGFIPRPTDQRFRFSMFFQDYLPMNPTYKMHLALYFGTSLPFGPPKSERYQQTFRMPPYRRVDIGFSKQIIGENTALIKFKGKSPVKSLWIGVEIFNLLQISNTISYLWVTDVSGIKYAVPNYLTPRQLNLRLVSTF